MTTVGEPSPAQRLERDVPAEPVVRFSLTRKARTAFGKPIPLESKVASCPKCALLAFGVVDVDPLGDYPAVRLVCLGCWTGWAETQLKGIEWILPVD